MKRLDRAACIYEVFPEINSASFNQDFMSQLSKHKLQMFKSVAFAYV
jgi:hypothetical protein